MRCVWDDIGDVVFVSRFGITRGRPVFEGLRLVMNVRSPSGPFRVSRRKTAYLYVSSSQPQHAPELAPLRPADFVYCSLGASIGRRARRNGRRRAPRWARRVSEDFNEAYVVSNSVGGNGKPAPRVRHRNLHYSAALPGSRPINGFGGEPLIDTRGRRPISSQAP